MHMSARTALTVHTASSGSPESGPTLPPMRNGSVAPAPASKAMRAATGSQSGPMHALPMPRSISRRRMKVESPEAPPPGLSAPSERTTGPPSNGERLVERFVDRGVAHGSCSRRPISSSARRRASGLRLRRIAVGVDEQLGAHLGHVAPGEAVRERDREDAVLALHRHQAVDVRAGRLARGVHRDDHLAVDHRGDRPDAAFDLRRAEIDQLERALEDVGVRIFLVGDQQVGALDHRRREVVVRIELGADDDLRADDGAHALQQVAFAIVVAVGDHRAVQAEQHHVDRQRRAQVGEQLVAQRFLGGARRRAARLGAGDHALDELPALLLAAQPRCPGRARKKPSGPGACRPGK